MRFARAPKGAPVRTVEASRGCSAFLEIGEGGQDVLGSGARGGAPCRVAPTRVLIGLRLRGGCAPVGGLLGVAADFLSEDVWLRLGHVLVDLLQLQEQVILEVVAAAALGRHHLGRLLGRLLLVRVVGWRGAAVHESFGRRVLLLLLLLLLSCLCVLLLLEVLLCLLVVHL